jgi:general secretion pathway protein I
LTAQRTRGFTLLEVLVAIAILGLGMTAILSAQTGLFASSSYAEKISLASGKVRCRLSELELKLNKEGYPLTDQKDEGNCCNDEVTPGYKCKWKIEKIELPLPPTANELSNQMSSSGLSSTLSTLGSMSGFGPSGSSAVGGSGLGDLSKMLATPGGIPGGALSGLPGLGGGMPGSPAPTDSGNFAAAPFSQSNFGSSSFGSTVPGTVPLGSAMPDQTALATGSPLGGGTSSLAPMAMSMVYPTLKPMLEASIRKLTVTVEWQGGGKGKSLDVVEYVTNPMQGGLDPNAANGLDTAMGALQQMLGIPTGAGTGTTGTGTAPAATTPSLFGGLH